MKASCPECDAEIELEDVLIGEIVECPDCGLELEVVSIQGDEITVIEAESEEEDWGE
ncbi:MAG: lysine biosynthesis protein LysW [Candidatus Geothermarchaeales archaeon]